MTIQITTDANGPQVTFGLTPKEFEDFKQIVRDNRSGYLSVNQQQLQNQIIRNLNRLSFKKSS